MHLIHEVETSLFSMKAYHVEETKSLHFVTVGRANVDLAVELQRAAIDFGRENKLDLKFMSFDLSNLKGTFTQKSYLAFMKNEALPFMNENEIKDFVVLLGSDPFTSFALTVVSKLLSSLNIYNFKNKSDYDAKIAEIISKHGI